jgi:hypothetical protein
MEYLAHLVRSDIDAGRIDVPDGQDQAVDRARLRGRDPLPKMNDASEPGGVNCITR